MRKCNPEIALLLVLTFLPRAFADNPERAGPAAVEDEATLEAELEAMAQEELARTSQGHCNVQAVVGASEGGPSLGAQKIRVKTAEARPVAESAVHGPAAMMAATSNDDIARLKIAVSEYLQEGKIANPKVEEILRKIRRGEIKESLHDPVTKEYTGILTEIVNNSRALHRIETQPAFYNDLLGVDQFALADIEKPQAFRVWSLQAWLRLILSIISPKQLKYSFAQRFAHDLKMLDPKRQMKMLVKMVSKGQIPPLSDVEAFKIISAFDGVNQIAAYQILSKITFKTLDVYPLNETLAMLSTLDPPALTKILKENKLNVSIHDVLSLSRDHPELFQAVTEQPAKWGIDSLSFNNKTALSALADGNHKLEPLVLQSLVKLLPSQTQRLDFLHEILAENRAVNPNDVIKMFEQEAAKNLPEKAAHVEGQLSKQALIGLLGLDPELVPAILKEKQRWGINYTFTPEDTSLLLAQSTQVNLPHFRALMDGLSASPETRTKTLQALIEKNLFSTEQLAEARSELAQLHFTDQGAALGARLAAKVSVLLAAKNSAVAKAAFSELFSLSSDIALEILGNKNTWGVEVSLTRQEIEPLLAHMTQVPGAKLSSQKVERVLQLFARTDEKLAFLEDLRTKNLAEDPSQIDLLAERFRSRVNLDKVTVSMSDALSLARSSKTYAASDSMLAKFFEKNKTELSIDQACELADAMSTTDKTNQILREYSKIKIEAMTVKHLQTIQHHAKTYALQDEVAALFGQVHLKELTPSDAESVFDIFSSGAKGNSFLESYVGANKARLEVRDVLALQGKASTYATGDRLVSTFAGEHIKDMEVRSVIELAERMSDSAGQNRVLTHYFDAHVHELSVDEVITLQASARTYAAGDRMLREYVKAFRGRLSADVLRSLAERASTSSLTDEILSSALD